MPWSTPRCDAGITLFDTADIYGAERGLSETLMGEALRGRRDDVVLATKFGHGYGRRERARLGGAGHRDATSDGPSKDRCGGSRPTGSTCTNCTSPIRVTPIEETLGALNELVVTEGKVRYIGSSNLAGWQIAEAEY